ncbi:LVIVD repeat-containing protein [Hyalangium versicolor]|uniref:LVIVD repeat-containing protein n=1 Tax=Hyalangium versicolor TaxID=2861190 RepID=UPI001CCEA14B|nr:hypothetical protein [Hyalangium versicolor]
MSLHPRRAGACLVTCCALLLAGCSSKPEVPETPPTDPSDPGDAVDTGSLAPCSYSTGSSAACGDLAAFNLESCDRGSLERAPTSGVFILKSRVETSASPTGGILFANAMHLVDDGNPSILLGGPATTEARQGSSFYMTREATLSNGDLSRTAYAGCQVSSSQHLTGCYVNCRNGRVRSYGTFEALRAAWPEGESESGGLELVSESFVSLGLPADIYVAKGYAYVVSLNANGRTGGLTVFDVADKAHPVFQRTVTMPGDSYWNGVWSKGDALYVASANHGVLVFDISKPAEPVFVRNLPQDAIDVHTVFVEGDRLYAMSPDPHVETLIFDISQPLSPVLLTRFSVPGGQSTGYPHDAFAYQGRLYINHWNLGYIVTDVSNPSQVEVAGRYVYANQSSHANAVGTFNGRTIAFEGGEGYDAHLRVLDVTDPAHGVKLAEWRLRPQFSIHNMVLVGTRLYIAHYQEGVRVLDVSNPSEPKQIAWYNTFRETDFQRGYSFYEGAIGMRVPGDGYVYTVDTSRGLLIFREP